MRALPELLSDDPAWPTIRSWVAASSRDVVVVPPERADSEWTLLQLQVTTRSVLGALAFYCGGLVVDHGWIRILGGGGGRLPGLRDWNWGGGCVEGEPLEGALLIAHDILGGSFAVNDTAFAGDAGEV